MDKKSIIDYLTTFELMSDKERSFFRNIGSSISSAIKFDALTIVDAYRKTPTTIKVGILTSAVMAGLIFGHQAISKTEPEVKRICVDYHVERAPLQSPLYGHECVTPDELAKMHKDPYTTIIR